MKRDVTHLKKWQQKIHEVIFGYETTAGKLFDVILLVVILASVMEVMLGSVPQIKQEYLLVLNILEWIFTILFSLEYIARLVSSPNPLKYVFSFMGIIDLLSLIPTYLGLFIDGTHALSVIRSIRLIRVFRILKLTHFMGGAEQLGNALWSSRHKIIVFLGTVLCLVVIIGTMIYTIEGGENGFTSIPKSIYWAIVTITTVGYGDLAPGTWLGQTLASALMIIGYAILAVPTGIVTNEIMRTELSRNSGSCPNCKTKDLPQRSNYCLHCGVKLP
ncbi:MULTISPECIES: ion transporter [Reichenbachiella]|uniref:Voltage-gated potassium channel n=1 Tax=Reichenbachiella agariperforans TaxID=156994 RepID=A0A1M6NRA9_REIAG|nr:MULTISPECIES: ion transporter [Reichenbachiella]MBU2916002.1 ion transporter [Reichenbachiella agariperforans]RJE71756.1 ion transporter [Reichenbachiella sp. MSK19-1]SHJ98239.1 voltage-gated potassium channel [Reichenbachiella agariperforans]